MINLFLETLVLLLGEWHVSANGHSAKNVFDMFSRTDRMYDVLPVHSCHVENVVLMYKAGK